MGIMLPDKRKAFAADPFGYATSAWYQWGLAQTRAGFPVDLRVFPTSRDLKDPILWLTHACALSEAAVALVQTTPNWEQMPLDARQICDAQFCGVALMLVGYSLEVSLKAMEIIKKGIDTYESEEKKYLHHDLEKLANFVPSLSLRDKSILKLLTRFTLWAGRYPDPGQKFDNDTRSVFELSERLKVTAKDVFALSAKIMEHAKVIVETA